MSEVERRASDASRTGLAKVAMWLSLVLALCGGAYLLFPKRGDAPELLTVKLGDTVFRTEATGRIVPREELFVRSLVSGQLVELRVRPGDAVKKGAHLATVRIVADPVMLGEARAQVRMSEMRLAAASRELARLSPLKPGTALSGKEVAKAEDDERLARTDLEGLKDRLRMIEKGVANSESGRSTHITATIDGVVLATPVAVGDFISDMNAYRDGTTIAVLADMSHLLFKGQIEEAHVGKLSLGMPAVVRVGALPSTTTQGRLAWVSPRATVESASGPNAPSASSSAAVTPLTSSTAGITRFELWIELVNAPSGMRAGYTASAELTLERRTQVPVLEERVLRFDRGKVFARVLGKEGRFEEREIQVGVSDGIKIEIVSGLAPGDKIAAYADP
jgi:HlyD family secretion protein